MCHEPINYETSFRAYLAHLAVTFEPGEPGEFDYFLGGVRNLHRKCQYQLFLDDHSEMKEFKGKQTTFFYIYEWLLRQGLQKRHVRLFEGVIYGSEIEIRHLQSIFSLAQLVTKKFKSQGH